MEPTAITASPKVSGQAPLAALKRFARQAQRAAGVRGEVCVWLASAAEIQRLNREFRGKNASTDVLSFPSPQGGGDIAISAPTARAQARRHGHSAAEEIKILILHGMLHLAGYDHERDNGRMARREERLRRQLRLPSGLITRTRSRSTA
jgi:probable rRNA maturation factor